MIQLDHDNQRAAALHPHHRRHGGWLRAAALLAVLLPAACSGSGAGGTSGAGSTGSAATATNYPAARDFAIEVYQGGSELGGELVQLSAILGLGKPVILNFWAGLCPPCRAEMPEFQEVYEAYGGEVLLVGIDLGPFTGLGTNAQGRALLQELGVTYPAGTTSDASVISSYQVLGMPSTYFITAEGGITRKWTGLLNRQKLSELTEALVETSGS